MKQNNVQEKWVNLESLLKWMHKKGVNATMEDLERELLKKTK